MKRLFFTAVKNAFFKVLTPKSTIPIYRIGKLERFAVHHSLNSQVGFNTYAIPDMRLNNLEIRSFDLSIHSYQPKDDFRAVIEPARVGTQLYEQDSIQCQAIHRVAVRGVLDSIDTTYSEEVSLADLDLLNTTHSSYISSESSEY
jgi:hypothetical protein